MRPEQHLYLADALREYREQLEEILAEVSERREPLGVSEARRIADLTAERLTEVEGALRWEARKPSRWSPMRRVGLVVARVRSWSKPRIGRLRHYPPKPLRVPASYLRVTPPTQAPTISIVTPSFRQGRFIGRTMHSVISQDYPALEYVVQDGGSNDGTLEVLHRFDGRLTSWASEEDGGQADAINRGFSRTTGEIMGWLNSDDLLLPGSLAYVARYLVEHPEVDVVYGNRIMIDEDDGQIGAWILPAHDDRALTLADYVPQETLFWRRSIWEAAGGRVDPSFGFALDWDLLLRFRDAGASIVRLPRFLGAFRVHDEQKTNVADALGLTECARLRERVHGRALTIDEVLSELRPYLLRHIVLHTRQRFIDRLPLSRVNVRRGPRDPFLSGAASSAAGGSEWSADKDLLAGRPRGA